MIPPALVLMLIWPGAWEPDPLPAPAADPTVGLGRELAFRRAEWRFLDQAKRRPGRGRLRASPGQSDRGIARDADMGCTDTTTRVATENGEGRVVTAPEDLETITAGELRLKAGMYPYSDLARQTLLRAAATIERRLAQIDEWKASSIRWQAAAKDQQERAETHRVTAQNVAVDREKAERELEAARARIKDLEEAREKRAMPEGLGALVAHCIELRPEPEERTHWLEQLAESLVPGMSLQLKVTRGE